MSILIIVNAQAHTLALQHKEFAKTRKDRCRKTLVSHLAAHLFIVCLTTKRVSQWLRCTRKIPSCGKLTSMQRNSNWKKPARNKSVASLLYHLLVPCSARCILNKHSRANSLLVHWRTGRCTASSRMSKLAPASIKARKSCCVSLRAAAHRSTMSLSACGGKAASVPRACGK